MLREKFHFSYNSKKTREGTSNSRIKFGGRNVSLTEEEELDEWYPDSLSSIKKMKHSVKDHESLRSRSDSDDEEEEDINDNDSTTGLLHNTKTIVEQTCSIYCYFRCYWYCIICGHR